MYTSERDALLLTNYSPQFTSNSVDDFVRQTNKIGLPRSAVGTYLFLSYELPSIPGKHDFIAYVRLGYLADRINCYGKHFFLQNQGMPFYDDYILFAHLKPLNAEHRAACVPYGKIATILDLGGYHRKKHGKRDKPGRQEQVRRIHLEDDGHRDLVHKEMFPCLKVGMTFEVHTRISNGVASKIEEHDVKQNYKPRWNDD